MLLESSLIADVFLDPKEFKFSLVNIKLLRQGLDIDLNYGKPLTIKFRDIYMICIEPFLKVSEF
jgi:hypothetical protein